MKKKILKKAEQGTSTPKLKPGQVTAKRAYEIADSLDKREANIDMYKKVLFPKNEMGERRLQEYRKNKSDASRIRSAADLALNKKKMGGKVVKKKK